MNDELKAILAQALSDSGDKLVAVVEDIVAKAVAAAGQPAPGGITPEQEKADLDAALAKQKEAIKVAVEEAGKAELEVLDKAIESA